MHNNIMDNDYLKKTLALFCEGIIELDVNLKSGIYVTPVSLEKALNTIKTLTLINNIEFDSSLKSVYELISKPLKDWNMPFIENAIENKELLDIIIYNKKYKLMSKYRNGILSGAMELKKALCEDDIEEYFELNKPFYELRSRLTQEDYEIFRTFMQDKSLLEEDDISDFMFEMSNSSDGKFVKDNFIVPLDESLVYSGTTHLCVNCGFPMRKNSLGELVCNFTKCVEKKKIMDIDLNANIEFKIQKGKKYYTLSNHAQKYMKIPGIAEKELKSELVVLDKKYKSFDKLELFPKKDTVDFKVTVKKLNGELYNLLDVKDYLSPDGLAKMIHRELTQINSKVSSLLESKSDTNQEYRFLIIVPDYLIRKDKDYEKKFKNTLKSISGSSYVNIEIYSVSKYIKYLSKKLKDFDKEIKEEKEKKEVQMNLFNN